MANNTDKRTASSDDDDDRQRRLRNAARQLRLRREEMETMRDSCREWLREMGYLELREPLNEACQAQGPFKIIAQLFAAVFGGEVNGNPYDGLESISFDELAEAIAEAGEGEISIREAIKASRWLAKADEPTSGGFVSGFDRTRWDF